MAETFDGAVKISVNGTLSKDIDLGVVSHVVNQVFNQSFANGTAINKANEMFVDTRTIAASGTDALDLAGGLTNGVGTTINFTSIKGMIIIADSGNTNDVQIGGAATGVAFVNWVASYTDIVNVKPGGMFCLVNPTAAGYAVTASTGDILNITNSSSGTGVTYTIVLIGTV
jgi:hypothetical protein